MDTSLYEVGRPTLRGARAPNHECYRQVRKNMLEVLSGVPEGLVVPACPEWTIRDLVGHLVGSAALAIGRMSGWLATFPGSSQDMDTQELLGVWDQLGGEVDLLLADRADRGERTGNLLVTDAFTHELDARYAVGASLPDEHPAFASAFEVLANGFSAAVIANDLPALRLSTGTTQWTVGEGEPAATVTASRHDLCRSIAGRRSHEQITALSWDCGSHRWLPAFTWGPFSPPRSPVEEPAPR